MFTHSELTTHEFARIVPSVRAQRTLSTSKQLRCVFGPGHDLEARDRGFLFGRNFPLDKTLEEEHARARMRAATVQEHIEQQEHAGLLSSGTRCAVPSINVSHVDSGSLFPSLRSGNKLRRLRRRGLNLELYVTD